MRSIYDRSFGFLNSEQQVARHVGFMLGWFSTLKMELLWSSETSVRIWTTQLYMPDDGNSRNYHCENLKSYVFTTVTKTFPW
jgi:hypothetical protein